jgi:hypothetical protein
MPEPVVIANEPAPAMAPDNEATLTENDNVEIQGEEQLLAGKYKTVDELVKGYKELESQQGRADEPETELAEGEEQSAKEIYGEFIGGRLEEAGIDFNDMSSRYAESGMLQDDDYGELEKAGFSRNMVDNYLAGLQYNAAQDSALNAQQVSQIKTEFGGAEEYDAMTTWAAENMQGSNDGAQIRLAIAGLYAQYTASEGREPQLLGGKPSSSSGSKFESTAQVIEAMNDPRYQTDPAYRKAVEKQLARSAVF